MSKHYTGREMQVFIDQVRENTTEEYITVHLPPGVFHITGDYPVNVPPHCVVIGSGSRWDRCP